jgi:hypothetical protein
VRTPAPVARAAIARPITSTRSARRSSVTTGNNTCVTRHAPNTATGAAAPTASNPNPAASAPTPNPTESTARHTPDTKDHPQPAADKGYVSAELDRFLAERGVRLLRPSYRNRTPRPGEHLLKPVRQLIESVFDTLKGQLDIELHGGRSIDYSP